MKYKKIILIVLLCIYAIVGCGREKSLIMSDEKTSSSQINTSEETSVKNEMTIILKDNETGNLLENRRIDDKEKISLFNEMCSQFKNPVNEKYSKAFFDSITSNEYTLYFSSSDFNETVPKEEKVVIVECNGLYYELTTNGKEWKEMVDYLEMIYKLSEDQ